MTKSIGPDGSARDTDGDGVAELEDDHLDFQGGDARNVGAVGAESAEIESNDSVVVGATDDIEPYVIADDGTLYGIKADTDEFVSSTNIRDGYTVVSSLPYNSLNTHALHMTAGGTFLTAAGGSIYRSTDGGSSWSAVQSLQQSGSVRAISENTNGDIIASEYDQDPYVWQSSDDGANWSIIANPTDLSQVPTHVHRVRYAPSDPNRIVLTYGDDSSNNPGYYRSDDNGSTFDHLNPTDPMPWNGNEIVFHPENADIYFMGGMGPFDGIIKIEDDGTNQNIRNHQKLATSWGSNSRVYQLSAVEKPDGSYYFIGSTADESAGGGSTTSEPMVVASVGEQGLRWRGVARIQGQGWRQTARSQGPSETVLSVDTNPHVVSRGDVLSLHEMANPIYGTYNRQSFGPGESVNFGDRLTLDQQFQAFISGWPSIQISDLAESGRLLELGASRGLRIGENATMDRTRHFQDVDLLGNRLRGNGANSRVELYGWANSMPQDLSGISGSSGDLAYHDGNDGSAVGFYEWDSSNGQWSGIGITSGTTITPA